MVEATQPKRIRIRTKASDTLSLARTFKSHLTRQSIFIKSAKVLQAGTSVTVELLYTSGERAIYGEGKVSWARSEGADKPAGLAIELEWDPPSRALVEQILTSPSLAPPPPLRRPTSQISSSTLPARPTSTPRLVPPRSPPGDFGAAFAEETSQHGSIVQIDEPTGRLKKADLPAPPPPSATPHSGFSLPPLPPPPRPPPRAPSVVPSASPPPVSIPAPTQSMPPPTESMPAPPLVESVPPPTVDSVPPISASSEVLASELISELEVPAVIAVPSATADLLPFATADLAPSTADLAAPPAAPPAAEGAPATAAEASDASPPKGEEAWFEGKPAETAPTEAPPSPEKKGVWGWFKKTFGGAPKPSDP